MMYNLLCGGDWGTYKTYRIFTLKIKGYINRKLNLLINTAISRFNDKIILFFFIIRLIMQTEMNLENTLLFVGRYFISNDNTRLADRLACNISKVQLVVCCQSVQSDRLFLIKARFLFILL